MYQKDDDEFHSESDSDDDDDGGIELLKGIFKISPSTPPPTRPHPHIYVLLGGI